MFEYNAICVSAYDGDTVTVDIDLGFNIWMRGEKVRLFGINTPEVRGPEREEGLKVRDWLRKQIVDKEITLKTHKSHNKGKYGRWLGEIILDGENLNQTMLANGMARPY